MFLYKMWGMKMSKTKTYFLSFLLFVLAMPLMPSSAKTDRSDYIRQYLDLSGFIKSIGGIIELQADFTLKNISRSNELSDEFKKDFKEAWKDVMLEDMWSSGGFFDMMKPMFQDLTDQDLKEIINFYKSPAGAKLARLTQVMPEYVKTLIPSWERRAEEKLVPEIFRRLQSKGWDPNGKRIK